MKIDIQTPTADLYDCQAENFAKSFNKPESSQLRHFYNELLKLEQIALKSTPEQWGNTLPLVRMLNAKVAYAKGRTLVDDTFYSVFSSIIKSIESPAHLTNAKRFIESTIGFKKLHHK